MDEGLPPVSPAWSPVAHVGGYQASGRAPGAGARQAELLGEVVAESEPHHRRRAARGPAEEHHQPFDPCFLL
ncbi:hypothetical protein ACFRMQ_02160 [Kitasatospora sp. NPDC056783]|uniref:hypothetical protein n=1 Tax=Kitasatospora sp. NPDC056783 TaxID=3345943 RepID=UPI0036A6DC6B